MPFEKMLRSSRYWILAGCLLLTSGFILSLWEPADEPDHSICFFRQVTGISCPGCGLTRGLAAVVKFDFSKAIEKHPLSPFLTLEVLLLWIYWGLIAADRMPLPSSLNLNRFLAFQGGLLLVIWSYRLTAGILPT